MLPHHGVLRAEVIGTFNLRDLAASAENKAALARPPAQKPAHRYPGTVAALRAGLPMVRDATVTITGKQAVTKAPDGFVGIYGGLNATVTGDLEPPDQGLAVNNGQVVEIVNDSVEVFDTTGKVLAGPISNYTLFHQPATASVGDPHAEYDAAAGRWFFDGYLIKGSFNGFALAVSKTSDPLGAYTVYQISDDSSAISGCFSSCFGDYPQVGYDANGFYIAADLFSNVTGQFVQAGVYALPLAQLVAGTALSYQYFLFPDFVVEPSIPAKPGAYATGAGGTEFLMTATNIYDGTDNLRVYAITNTAAIATAGGLAAHSVTVAAEPYGPTVPSTEPNDVGPYGVSLGATTSPQLDGGYNAFGSGVKYLNGQLYGALTSGSTDANGLARDIVAFFKVSAAATATAVQARIAQQGYIVPPTGYSISYPGIALNAQGTGIIGTTITNPNAAVIGGYPSAGFVKLAATGPSSTYVVTGQGAASDDGFSGYSGSGPAGVGRWGDFSSATVDPVSGYYYVGNEFIPDASIYPRTTYENWGTFITEVK